MSDDNRSVRDLDRDVRNGYVVEESDGSYTDFRTGHTYDSDGKRTD